MSMIFDLIKHLLTESCCLRRYRRQRVFSCVVTFLLVSACNAGRNSETTISDFEDMRQILEIKTLNSEVSFSGMHHSSGDRALKIRYLGSRGQISSIRLGGGFLDQKHDWGGYDFLEFYLFNPDLTERRLILQLKDRNGGRCKRDIIIPAKQGQVFRIPIAKLAETVNVALIDEVAFFCWEPKNDTVLFIDNIRLVKAG